MRAMTQVTEVADDGLTKEQLRKVNRPGFRGYKPESDGYDERSTIVAPRHLYLAVGLSAVTVWRLRNRDQFPPPIQLSPGRVGWRRSDLERWLAQREAASR